MIGYRRSKEKREWKIWLKTYRARLLHEYGIPFLVLENMSTWWYFLEHGYVNSPEGICIFDLGMLSQTQAFTLCQVLEEEKSSEQSHTCQRLKYLLQYQMR